MVPAATVVITTAAEVTKVLCKLADTIKDIQVESMRQETERERIRATLVAYTKALKSRTTLVTKAIEAHHETQRMALKICEAVLLKEIEMNRDDKTIEATSKRILEILDISPDKLAGTIQSILLGFTDSMACALPKPQTPLLED